MKIPRIANAINYIDEELINNAVIQKTVTKTVWIRWSALAACITILLIISGVVMPSFFEDSSTTFPAVTDDNTSLQEIEEKTTKPGTEAVFWEAYCYNVSDGAFSSYMSGKVISADRIGRKLEDVSVTAGWKNNKDEWKTQETLRAEVYLINGISKEVAVALRFIDKGDALTTTHYYVIMNPDADLSSVKDYIIASEFTDNSGEVSDGEVIENELAGEYVVEYTSQLVIE